MRIAINGETGRSERLFRAAVAAFCCITRPTRREIGQLEDLTLPLFDAVSVASRRYVAAVLSECEHAPPGLVRRLADETVDIAAPLLIRSPALTDIDLIALIGRHGIAHARAIARRPALHPTIAELIRAIDKPRLVAAVPAALPPEDRKVMPQPLPFVSAVIAEPADPGVGAENARRRLRSMMLPSGAPKEGPFGPPQATDVYARLRDTALTGNAAFFQTALADALGVDFGSARAITETASYFALLPALRVLDLSGEQAFVIAAARFPAQFSHPESIRLFLDRFRLLHREAAVERIRALKTEAIAGAVRGTPTADNSAGQAAPKSMPSRLRA